MAAWWYWTATASAETAGTVEAPSADAGPVAAPRAPAPAEEPELLDLDPVVDVLTGALGLVDPIAEGLVDGLQSLTPVVRGVIDPLLGAQDPDTPAPQLVTSLPPQPADEPAVVPEPAPAPPRPLSRPTRPAPAPTATLPLVATETTSDPDRDERAWAPPPASAPSVTAPTPAAGTPPVTAHHDARPIGRAQSVLALSGPADTGLRTDRGQHIAGTPGALAALVAASTAALVSAAVEALEDGPGRAPPTTPD